MTFDLDLDLKHNQDESSFIRDVLMSVYNNDINPGSTPVSHCGKW